MSVLGKLLGRDTQTAPPPTPRQAVAVKLATPAPPVAEHRSAVAVPTAPAAPPPTLLRDVSAGRVSRADQLPKFRGVHPLRNQGIVALIDADDPWLLHLVCTEPHQRSVFQSALRRRVESEGYRVHRELHIATEPLIRDLSATRAEHESAEPTAARAHTPEMQAFHAILREVIAVRSSDIRISVRQGGGQNRTTLTARVAGTIEALPFEFDAATGLKMIGGIYGTYSGAGSGNVEVWTANVDQEAFLTVPEVQNCRLRYNLLPMADGTSGSAGPDVSLRILGYDGRNMRFASPERAGFSADQAAALIDAITSPRGLFLVVGPTGSGKTTLLATLLGLHPDLADGAINAIAIEDPPELDVPHLRSISVRRKGAGVDQDAFVAAMRGLLRHDPDICVPGEIRDAVSCSLVKQMTYSHKVCATFHASNFPSTLDRLTSEEIRYPRLSLGAAPFAGGLVAVASVGLLRRLCPHCARPALPELSEEEKHYLRTCFAVDPARLRVQGPGCTQCENRGHLGPTAIGEVVTLDDDIAHHIRAGDFNAAYLEYRRRSDGSLSSGVMTGKTLFEHALHKAQRGEVSIRELTKTVSHIKEAAVASGLKR